MEVKLFLSDDDCKKILESNGYTMEQVTVNLDTLFYHGSEKQYDDKPIKTYTTFMAYAKGERPTELNDQPLENINYDYHYVNVIRSLVKDKFVNLMCS